MLHTHAHLYKLRGGRVLLTEMLLPRIARQGIVCLNSMRVSYQIFSPSDKCRAPTELGTFSGQGNRSCSLNPSAWYPVHSI